MREVSKNLWYAGSTSGGLVRTCPHDITFFGGDGDWEDGEREDLEQKAEANPEKFRDCGNCYVSSCWLFGEEWVWDCPQCQARLLEYQNFIWNNRRVIAEFLNKTLKEESERAQKEAETMTVKELPVPTFLHS